MRLLTPLLVALTLAATPAMAQPPQHTNPDAELGLVHYNSAWDLMRSEKYEEAIAEFQQALKLNPKLNMSHYGIGRARMALHQYDAAIAEYTACRDYILTEEGRKYTGQAEADRARRDRMMELQDLQRQYSKGPQNTSTADMQRQIGNAMRMQQDATDRGQNISIDASVPAFLSVALGSAYFRADRRTEAEKAYRAAIAVDSRAGEAYNNLAVIYLLSERYELAEQSVKNAEKAGFHVNPDLKDQIKAGKK